MWGIDQAGQLGLGSKSRNVIMTPKLVTYQIAIKKVSCGIEHTGLLSVNGKVYMMGSNAEGQLGLKTTFSIRKPQIVDSLLGP